MAQCLHPRYVKTSSGVRKVDCGHCASCLNKKGIRNSCYIDLEHQSSSSQYFFTLTYCNYFLPVVRVDYSSKCCTYFANPYNRRIIDDTLGSSLYSWKCSEFNGHDDCVWSRISSKTGLPLRFVPVLYFRDVQLFIKRFRLFLVRNLNIDKSYVEKIRYYYCGEYGSKHYRPHFHFLLFIPEDIQCFVTSQHLRKAVRSTWTFGRVDFQRSKGKSSSYLAEYLNGNSSLTSFHNLKFFRQRSRHSNHFAESYFSTEPSQIVKDGPEYFSPQPFIHGGRVKFVLPPVSIERRFFPKCLQYRMLLPKQLLQVYTSFDRALLEISPRWFFPEKLASVLASKGLSSPTVLSLYDIFGYRALEERTLYGIFSCSYKFLNLCKKFDYRPFEYLDLIRNFYDNKEIMLLRSQYEAQDLFVRKYVVETGVVENIYFLSNFYDNFIFDSEKRNASSRVYVSSVVERNFLFNLNYGLNMCDIVTYEELHYCNNPQYIEQSQSSLQLFFDKVKHKKDMSSSDVDFIKENFNKKYYLYG